MKFYNKKLLAPSLSISLSISLRNRSHSCHPPVCRFGELSLQSQSDAQQKP